MLAAHVGQGRFLMTCIDGAVIDESDPLATDESLDIFNPANGFRVPPDESRYSSEFITRYRQAQSDRVRRIDERARGYVAEQNYYKSLMADPGFAKESLDRQRFIGRRAMVGRLLVTYRTEADPAYLDLSIKPSKRSFGSLIGGRPDLTNFATGSFAGVLTPRAWLSTWSGHTSNASVLDNLPKVTVPLLVVNYTGDNGIFPEDVEAMLSKSASSDKELHHVDGEHYGLPVAGAGGTDSRAEANQILTNWLGDRF
jgi:hypothetical protein